MGRLTLLPLHGGKPPPAVRRKVTWAFTARLPKGEAVVVTAPPGCGLTVADAMRRVRENVSLEGLGIASVQFKRARTGGLILEVQGDDSRLKADCLAAKMVATLADTGVRITRPAKLLKFRVAGLDESVSSEEMHAALCRACECPEGDITVGRIQRNPPRKQA